MIHKTVFSLLLILFSGLHSQSIYVEGNQHALGTALSWSIADDQSVPVGTIAYSYKGFIDMALATGKMTSVDMDYRPGDGRSVNIAPQILAFSLDVIKKPELDNNRGMSFLVGYQKSWDSTKDDRSDRGTLVEYLSQVYSVGVEAYWILPTTDPMLRAFVGFSPSASIGAQTITHSYGDYESAWDYSDILLGLTGIGAIEYRVSSTWKAGIEFAAGPSYSLNNQEAIQGFSFGFAMIYMLGA